MILFLILGVVVTITFVVVGVLFYLLSKEGQTQEPGKPVSLMNLDEIKKEVASQVFEQTDVKIMEQGTEVIPVFTPQAQAPAQPVQASVEDDKYKKRAQNLEDELLAISKKADGQSQEAKQLIESLSRENEALKAQQAGLLEARKKLDELEGEASGLRTNNARLEIQLESANTRVRLLEEEMSAFKLQMGDEISRANATISELRQKEEVAPPARTDADDVARLKLEALSSEYAQLKEKYEALEKTVQGLQEELIRARAQASGLERINFNYKNQLEALLQKNGQ